MGGLSATLGAMQALGLTEGLIGTSHAEALATLTPNLGKGTHVVVLGAGIAGLTAAYELEQTGFRVTLLETGSVGAPGRCGTATRSR
jgi:monoamine oxidase